jgi:hypothetical protein
MADLEFQRSVAAPSVTQQTGINPTAINPNNFAQQASGQTASIPYSQMNAQQKLQYDKDIFNNR